mmetsp:Transcript_105688/g.187950  ORF Transcript_105688/g.187950 Transcript_105688/m.187950 type:complete len:304 (-) Transcript_105688:175-1086(-)|eukprot:CAMPEP_0197663054 /NCGR_PEP_ID=MMETSP1338-20131121/55977_1 /TAXON_ID=43686 ORGANISM="Pelagodinium beii, Strain RCC1491" /NCGR_SAMPLE_ID=MMETSP1338 /ASSEMBLY_ACC=CAM_ASM_000754 /LENGTH=303 /DNA_ID=CAMNT_0043241247 /DNA_START=63 /DNA_END=974 /DNA_ORIENTATION=+
MFWCCAPKEFLAKNEGVGESTCFDPETVDAEGEVHALICGIDYTCDRQSWAGQKPLDTRHAFDMMVGLCEASGVATLKTLWNTQCTKEGILAAIEEVGAECGENDFFIFYYTGHGDQLPSIEGSHEVMDQCFCTVDQFGNTDDATMQYRNQVWLRDDDFARTLIDAIHDDCNVLVMVDACHSGTICDFHSGAWTEAGQTKAISISGSADSQTSAGTGRGGHFSRAIANSVMELQDELDDEPYSVGTFYNKVLENYDESRNPGHLQNIEIHGSGTRPHQMAWPLLPKERYISPASLDGFSSEYR